VAQLASVSQRLTTVARRVQASVFAMIAFGGLFTVTRSFKSERVGIIPTILFGFLQLALTTIPFVGLGAYTITNIKLPSIKQAPTTLMGKLLRGGGVAPGSNGERSRSGYLQSAAESSDCGTLGS
jgi:phage-related protein